MKIYYEVLPECKTERKKKSKLEHQQYERKKDIWNSFDCTTQILTYLYHWKLWKSHVRFDYNVYDYDKWIIFTFFGRPKYKIYALIFYGDILTNEQIVFFILNSFRIRSTKKIVWFICADFFLLYTVIYVILHNWNFLRYFFGNAETCLFRTTCTYIYPLYTPEIL